LGKFINPYIWCAVGALVGFLLGEKKADDQKLGVIENILVGVFGAFIGGDLIVSQLNHGLIDDKIFKFGSLLWAIGGAVGAIMLLRLLRRAVGPMRVAKKRKDDSF
jgi:uncharacterized membrane protein YeaQ/YmgE (transglycosylase-associated protein family)